MREELHHLVDELPEAQACLALIRGRMDMERSGRRSLPFFASFEADPDRAERSEDILRAEFGALDLLLCDTGVLLAAGNIKD